MSSRVPESRWPLVKQLVRLLHSWWRGDRIRASPRDGRLFRLKPPCYLLIEEQPVLVEGRSIEETDEGVAVVYHCRTAAQPAKLIVRLDGAAIEWHESQGARTVTAAEIEVYPVK